jgi:hypothetical protein
MFDAGMKVPAIEHRPTLIGYEWLWEAFLDLNTCRQNGMGVGSIPWTAVQKYAEVMRFDDEETWVLHGVIKHLDELFIKHHTDKQNQKK